MLFWNRKLLKKENIKDLWVFNHHPLENTRIPIWSYFLRMQSPSLDYRILLSLCIPNSVDGYLRKIDGRFLIYIPTACQSIAHGYNSSQERLSRVGCTFLPSISLPSLGCHLDKIVFTKSKIVQMRKAALP